MESGCSRYHLMKNLSSCSVLFLFWLHLCTCVLRWEIFIFIYWCYVITVSSWEQPSFINWIGLFQQQLLSDNTYSCSSMQIFIFTIKVFDSTFTISTQNCSKVQDLKTKWFPYSYHEFHNISDQFLVLLGSFKNLSILLKAYRSPLMVKFVSSS